MPSEIQVSYGNGTHESQSFTFPGGELQVRFPDLPRIRFAGVSVLARLQSAEDVIRLVLAAEILERLRPTYRRLVVPYFPYARQDRVMQPDEAFSLKPVTGIINALGFDEVVTYDLHSSVAAALIAKLTEVTQAEVVLAHAELWRWALDNDAVLVAPDAGAAKKTQDVARLFYTRWNRLPDVAQASKHRDVKTGKITGTALADPAQVAGRKCLILDDICDGGRTFTELARVLREAGAAEVRLYVTHGIFSQGLGVFAGLIDAVFTTDTFLSRDIESPHQSPIPLHICPIERIRP